MESLNEILQQGRHIQYNTSPMMPKEEYLSIEYGNVKDSYKSKAKTKKQIKSRAKSKAARKARKRW